MRVEYTYNKQKDITDVFIWKYLVLLEVREVEGELDTYEKKKMTTEIKQELDSKWKKEK